MAKACAQAIPEAHLLLMGWSLVLCGCGVLPANCARVTYDLDFINDILNGGSTGNVTKLLTSGTSVFDVYLPMLQDASATGSSDVEKESGGQAMTDLS